VTPRTCFLLPAVLLASAAASAQTPLPASSSPPASTAQPPSLSASATQPPSAAPSQGGQAPLDSPAYTYDPQDRRDPFISLSQRGGAAQRSGLGARPAGVSGLEVSDMALRGTMQSRTGYVALVEAADKKTYIVKAGDRLLDGLVRTITEDTMVILQQVNDPLSLEKQREVRKMLRQTDEVK
jgi:Tfp pilus assembly protein PilP